jgi:hypothetical protein
MTEPNKDDATNENDGATLTVEELTEKLKTSEANLVTANKDAGDAKTALKTSEDKLQNELYTPDYLQYIADKDKKANTPQPKKEQPDFEKMNMGEIVSHIKEEVGAAISASQEVAKEKIGELRNMVEAIIVSGDVDKVAGKYPDFYDYRESMVDLSKKQPQLGAESLYKLAKFGKIEEDISKKNTAAATDEHKKTEDVSKKDYKDTKEAASDIADTLGIK